MCLDGEGLMHNNCQAGDCYGELLRNMTSFEQTVEVLCGCCPDASQHSQRQCVLHVEPDTEVDTSIQKALAVRDVDGFNCESCCAMKARQQTRLGKLPSVLVVHISKYAHSDGPRTLDFLVIP